MPPCKGSLYFLSPKELNNSMRRLTNIQNSNHKCLRWCLVRYLNPVTKNQTKVDFWQLALAKQLNFKKVNFSFHKKDYTKIHLFTVRRLHNGSASIKRSGLYTRGVKEFHWLSFNLRKRSINIKPWTSK